MREEAVRSRDASISVAQISPGTLNLNVMAVACGHFSALDAVGFPVAEMQLRGFGSSTVTSNERSAFALHNYMADFDAVIASRGADQSVMFGYSHGGYFTTAYAIGNPTVRALILVEPALYTPKEELLSRIETATRGDNMGSIEQMLRYVDPAVGMRASAGDVATMIRSNINNEMAIAEEFRVRAENPIEDSDLAALQMPVLLIGGTQSRVNFMVKRAAQTIPYASVFWVRGATHLSLQDKEFASAIGDAINCFLNHIK